MAFMDQIAVEPGPAGTGLIDKDELRAFGLQPPDELIDVTLARPDITEGDDLGSVIFGGIGHGNRIFVDIKTDRDVLDCGMADLRECCMWQHEAALASRKLTRGDPGGQLTHRKSLCLGNKQCRNS
jgi:hypothetical protein